jgi:hypothetical protein
MTYLVRAEVAEPGAGIFRAETETRRDAIAQVQGLRALGLLVLITGPNGERVDEAAND